MDAGMTKLVETYMGLAQSLAQQVWRTAPHALELDELRGIAYLGLTAAAARWGPYCEENHYSPEALEFFRPFVVRRVRGALIDAIRSSDWATRSLRTRARQIQEASGGKHLPDAEIAERTGLSIQDVRATRRGMAQRPVSMEAEELDPSAPDNVESSAVTSAILAGAVDAMTGLDTNHQTVLALHYYQGMQLQQVAKTMGVTETRVSQLHAHAVLTVHAAMVGAAVQDHP
jgi:RNA polymerase sigma factor for flagellar operon FliA